MSTLLEIRTQFAKLSGRYDLVTGAFADAGADYYLKAGLRFLDRRVEFDKDVAKFFKTVNAGGYFVDFTGFRTVKKCWFATTGTDRAELEYLPPAELQEVYGSTTYPSVTRGTPTHFTLLNLRSQPEGQALSVISTYGSELLVDGSQTGKMGIMFMPPAASAGMIEVWAKYETPWPSAENKTNFWFDRFENIAVMAALYELEVSYRNTEGQKDWLAAIDLELLGIEKDTVETDADQAEEMRG